VSRTPRYPLARSRRATVEIPSPVEEHPRFARVGLVAAIGFAIGIAWPWLAGVRFAPSPPTQELTRPEAPAAPDAPAPAPSRSPNVPAAASAPAPTPTETKRINVGKGSVTSCRTADGKTLPACDPVPVDDQLVPRLEALQGCAGVGAAAGVLSIGIKLDLEAGKVTGILQGKSTTIDDASAHTLVACAEHELAALSLQKVPHAQASYTVFYLVEFAAAEEAGDDGAAHDATKESETTPASGMATVAWVAARIRKEPAKESPEVGRLLSGTRVKVLGRKGDWYRVRYNAAGDEGWVFRSAIGL
jgi:hypothetical protein